MDRITQSNPLAPIGSLAWEALINEWEGSQLTQPEFCENKAINYATFVYWRSKLKKPSAQSQAKAKPKLLPVQLRQETGEMHSSPLPDLLIHIALPSGIKMALPLEIDKTKLLVVLQALGIGAC